MRNCIQNYCDIFKQSTIIEYQIPSLVRNYNSSVLTSVRLNVFDVLGKEVATLVNENQIAGEYEVNFNASKLASGTYFYRLQVGEFSETKKMILLK
ncbi:MAG: T9SS type A sorting domain-containing protein [Ignavibacteriae bacterium]|nr:T9SS type A sorting domain-containing protein [Ignavibacteriota bacterium]